MSSLYPYAGVMNPAVADAVKAYEAKQAEAVAPKKADATPKAAAFLQTAAEGVPVLVQPTLR